MLKIRLQRTGRTNAPSFRVVVLEHARSTKAGNVLEQLGTYNPKTKAKNLNADRIKYWLSVGAQLSATVHNMLVSAGIIEGKKINVLPKKSPPKKEEATAEASVPEEPREEVPAPELKDDVKPDIAQEETAEVTAESK